jgi:hypothetical protein
VTSPRDYELRAIEGRTANEFQMVGHYLHRKAQAMFAYGMFDGEEMIGCVIFGKPASRALCVGLCGVEEARNVLELTRLWIKDGTPKNTESRLIGFGLRSLPREYDIIVSYAEIGAGHIGVVYQATNWIYTGMSDKHVEWHIDGQPAKHTRHLFDEYGGVNGAKEHFGARMTRAERPRKHRYVMIRGSKARRKELQGKLRYKVLPYPKVTDTIEA